MEGRLKGLPGVGDDGVQERGSFHDGDDATNIPLKDEQDSSKEHVPQPTVTIKLMKKIVQGFMDYQFYLWLRSLIR